MQRRKNQLATSFISFFIVTLFAIFQNTVGAEDQKFVGVVVERLPNGLSIDPVKVKRGITIVWINYDPGPIKIKFTTKLGIACRTPTNFYSDLFGYYETGKIPQGGVASVCLIYNGQYDYEIRRVFGKEQLKEEIIDGKVIVEE
jgi:hypothetical protein